MGSAGMLELAAAAKIEWAPLVATQRQPGHFLGSKPETVAPARWPTEHWLALMAPEASSRHCSSAGQMPALCVCAWGAGVVVGMGVVGCGMRGVDAGCGAVQRVGGG